MANIDLTPMIDEKLICFGLDVKDKNDAIYKIAQMMYDAKKITDKDIYLEGIYERENEISTGIGMGIAIPHCQSDVVVSGAFTLVSLSQPIEWGSLDDLPVNYVIMLAAPKNGDNMHLKMLSTLAMNLMDDTFRKGLLEAKSVEDIKEVFRKKGD